jgi:hypothetical protein
MKISAALIQLRSQNTQPSLMQCLHMPERGQILVLTGGRPAERWRRYATLYLYPSVICQDSGNGPITQRRGDRPHSEKPSRAQPSGPHALALPGKPASRRRHHRTERVPGEKTKAPGARPLSTRMRQAPGSRATVRAYCRPRSIDRSSGPDRGSGGRARAGRAGPR